MWCTVIYVLKTPICQSILWLSWITLKVWLSIKTRLPYRFLVVIKLGHVVLIGTSFLVVGNGLRKPKPIGLKVALRKLPVMTRSLFLYPNNYVFYTTAICIFINLDSIVSRRRSSISSISFCLAVTAKVLIFDRCCFCTSTSGDPGRVHLLCRIRSDDCFNAFRSWDTLMGG